MLRGRTKTAWGSKIVGPAIDGLPSREDLKRSPRCGAEYLAPTTNASVRKENTVPLTVVVYRLLALDPLGRLAV
jgi:hypothetical protein